jgi:hypothetical protein
MYHDTQMTPTVRSLILKIIDVRCSCTLTHRSLSAIDELGLTGIPLDDHGDLLADDHVSTPGPEFSPMMQWMN